ncbi:pyruvate kinase [bacterium]|nr:pyruvate kinase [bacterium]
MIRTKIICTSGPSVDSPDKMQALVEAGMSLIRINCSHGAIADRQKQLAIIRGVEKKMNIPIGIMADLQGPKLRVAKLAQHLDLHRDEVWKLSPSEKQDQVKKVIPVDYKRIAQAVVPGDMLYMDDGLIQTVVVKKNKADVWVKIIHGGILESRKGINIPNFKAHNPILNSKDKEDLKWALAQKLDFIAVSFVRTVKDIKDVRKFIAQHSSEHVPLVIAKIEKPEAVDNLDGIIKESDGILVARGDLGIELSPERVPVVQKQIIEQCRLLQKPVIVATQMLDSMRYNPRPTRAEVSDVASSIYAGADAVMLTGETSSGKYPIKATQMISKIVSEVETHMELKSFFKRASDFGVSQYWDAFVFNVMTMASDIKAKAIVVLVKNGHITKILSKMHPKQPVYSIAPNPASHRKLTLFWGVYPLEVFHSHLEKRIDGGLAILRKKKVVKKGEKLIFVYRDYKTDNLNLKVMEC